MWGDLVCDGFPEPTGGSRGRMSHQSGEDGERGGAGGYLVAFSCDHHGMVPVYMAHSICLYMEYGLCGL